MGFSIEVPLPGASFSTEGVKVGNALATISSWANGGIVGTDLAPSANIQASQLSPGLTVPTGTILPFAGAAVAAPPGYLVCNGSLQLRASYPALFSLIGVAYGAGDGVSNFALPDLQGRVPIGAGSGAGLTARTLGVKSQTNPGLANAGEEQHTLSAAEMPTHIHSVNDSQSPANVYTLTPTAAAGGSGRYQVAPWSTGFTQLETTPAGSSGTHNNMPPFQVINFLIKT